VLLFSARTGRLFHSESRNQLEFLLPRRAHVSNKTGVGSLVVPVIAASLAEAEAAIDRSANFVRVAVVLPVILPPADLA
jgi:hypothetical protein